MENICFVTGASDFYFGMAGILGTSLARYFPDVPFRVLDFGLTANQATFFERKRWLIRRPSSLDNIDHPYALKSHMARYLSNEPSTIIVWLDCDMTVTGGRWHDLESIINEMNASSRSVAACRDQGAASIAEFLASHPSPTLAERIDLEDRSAPYLNIGTTIFTDRAFLEEWPRLSERHQITKDFCFEQNAFNAWVRQNTEKFLELDARRWNVHGPLLGRTELTANGVCCEGENVFIIHPTSVNSTQHRLEQVTLVVSGHSLPAVIKWFRNIDLRKLQAGFLSTFLRENRTGLLECGVLTTVKPDPQYMTLTLN